jgi:hypothetical protein
MRVTLPNGVGAELSFYYTNSAGEVFVLRMGVGCVIPDPDEMTGLEFTRAGTAKHRNDPSVRVMTHAEIYDYEARRRAKEEAQK